MVVGAVGRAVRAVRAGRARSRRMGWVCEEWCKFENGVSMAVVWVLHRFDIFGQWQRRAYLLPAWMCKRREASGRTFGDCRSAPLCALRKLDFEASHHSKYCFIAYKVLPLKRVATRNGHLGM